MKNVVLTILVLFGSLTYAKLKTEVVMSSENTVWGFDFINQDEIVFSHRSGKLWHYNIKTKKKQEITGLPKIKVYGQGGLLDVLIENTKDKTFVNFTYSKPVGESINTTLARAELKENKLINLKDIFVSKVNSDEKYHFGSRILLKDNMFYITIGDRGQRDNSQSLKNHNGTIIRVNKDGSIPKDNPFIKNKDALASIWSYGHRNPQGIDLNPLTNEIWSVEFGPRGGDEINLVKPGVNYGWPIITYGKEYWGPSIGDTHKKGMEQPVKYYVPSISPSGMVFYTGDKIKEWKNHLFIAALGSEFLMRAEIKNKKVVNEERLLEDLDERIRQVRNGADGFLYFSTDSGKIYKVSK